MGWEGIKETLGELSGGGDVASRKQFVVAEVARALRELLPVSELEGEGDEEEEELYSGEFSKREYDLALLKYGDSWTGLDD